MVYDVEFISGSYEFDCEVNAMTGEIVKFEKEYDGAAVSNVSVEEHGEQSEHSQTEENQAVSNISLEKAKEIALDHAGVKATDATFVKAKSDYEDGRAVFEIEFVVSSGNTIKEYDYEIVHLQQYKQAAVRIQVKFHWKRPRRLLYPMPVLQVPMLLRWRENWIGMMACLFMRLNLKLEAMSTAMKLMQPQDRLSNSIRSGMIK